MRNLWVEIRLAICEQLLSVILSIVPLDTPDGQRLCRMILLYSTPTPAEFKYAESLGKRVTGLSMEEKRRAVRAFTEGVDLRIPIDHDFVPPKDTKEIGITRCAMLVGFGQHRCNEPAHRHRPRRSV